MTIPALADCLRNPDVRALVEALEIADSWLERWATHVGQCRGGDQCSCGLRRIVYDIRAVLATIETQAQAGPKGEAE